MADRANLRIETYWEVADGLSIGESFDHLTLLKASNLVLHLNMKPLRF